MFGYRFPLFLCCALAAASVFTACRTTPPPPPKPPVRPPVQPTPKPVLPPSATMSLRDYLKQQLGAGFHTREEWAGAGPEYAPQPYGERVWAAIGNVFAVTIHHAEMQPREDTAEMIRSIFRDHTRPGGRLDAADVGYHFFIDFRGQVWEGRDAGHIGTHVGSRPPGLNNPCNLGICGLGAYGWEDPPQVMVDQAVNMATLIAQYFGRPLLVRGHRDWSGINGEPNGCTTCPGRLESAVFLATQQIQVAFPNAAASGSALAATPAPATTAPAASSLPASESPPLAATAAALGASVINNP